MNRPTAPEEATAWAAELGFVPMALPPLPAEPLVSVLVSNYNYRAYLGEAIEGVLGQTHRALEVVVVDDGSTDGSEEAAREVAARDARVTVIGQANGGQAAALNTAFAACRGDVVCLLDSDDVYEPTKVAQTVELFRQSPRAGFAVHRVLAVDRDNRPVARDPAPWPLSQGWCAPTALGAAGPAIRLPPTSALALRREVADRLFPLDESLVSAADGFWHRLAPLMTEIVATPEPLSRYRIHGSNVGMALFETPKTLAHRLHEAELIHAAARRFISATFGEGALAAFGPVEKDATWQWTRAWLVLVGDATPAERRDAAAALLERPDRVPFEPVFRTTLVWPALGAAMLRTAVTDNPVKRAAKRLQASFRG